MTVLKCVTCEKKIVVPVQLCVLSTGFAQAAVQQNAICTTFPTLFPNQIKPCDTIENCGESCEDEQDECGECNDSCDRDERCERSRRPQPRR